MVLAYIYGASRWRSCINALFSVEVEVDLTSTSTHSCVIERQRERDGETERERDGETERDGEMLLSTKSTVIIYNLYIYKL